MQFRKIAGPQVFTTGNGGEPKEYPLPASSGGHMVKGMGYMIKFLGNSGANARAGLRLDHGPDGSAWVTHSTPIAVAAIPAGGLAAGDTYATTAMIQEVTRGVLLCQSNDANQQSFTAEIYEMRKPF